MRLEMPGELAARYSSPSQRTRVVSEAWAEDNLYCSNCPSDRLRRLPTNTPAIDFECPRCTSLFQLKSQHHRFATRINDAAYSKMREAILERRTPNVLALHYDPVRWTVQNLTLVPSFAFSLSCLQKRNALRPSAERAGWVGCNILLVNIPLDARIPVVADGKPRAPAWVRRQYERLRPLERLKVEARGWTLDVLNVVRGIGRREFTLGDVYAHEAVLARLHPDNRHVRPKIRQQLQILRDLGFLEFVGGGRYRVETPR
jgi:type II restriction enzyme